MSARSRIGYMLPTGEIRSIYCHSDGYLSGVGATLREHYTTFKKIKELVMLGDLSLLGQHLAPPSGIEHYFDYPRRAPGVTVAYHRDRGEKGCESVLAKNEAAFLAIDSNQEYSYLWKNEKWYVWDHAHELSTTGGELTAEMIAEALA
jgi:hypothetical protein